MSDGAPNHSGDVRQRLSALLNQEQLLDLVWGEGVVPGPAGASREEGAATYIAPTDRPVADVLVTYNEVSSHHGTGILLRNLLRNRASLVSIRTNNTYGGEQDVGVFRYTLNGQEPARPELFRIVSDWSRAWTPRNVICVPYSATELLIAIALKELHGARLCLDVMDDQNVVGNHIPDDVMQEAVRKADLRLLISTEMMMGYQDKWNERFYVLPLGRPCRQGDPDRQCQVGRMAWTFCRRHKDQWGEGRLLHQQRRCDAVELRRRGLGRHLVMARLPEGPLVYYANPPVSIPGSWGNAVSLPGGSRIPGRQALV